MPKKISCFWARLCKYSLYMFVTPFKLMLINIVWEQLKIKMIYRKVAKNLKSLENNEFEIHDGSVLDFKI